MDGEALGDGFVEDESVTLWFNDWMKREGVEMKERDLGISSKAQTTELLPRLSNVTIENYIS
jgi:predicted secreted hydrolase